MTAAIPTAAGPARPEEVEAARLLLARLGVSPADLLGPATPRREVPTFAGYVPVVAEGVGAGSRRVYASYWNRIVEQWGDQRLDEPTPSDVQRLVEHVRTHVVARRNARGGRSAALRCVYRHAIADGLISEADNPAAKVAKPRRLPSTSALSSCGRKATPSGGSRSPTLMSYLQAHATVQEIAAAQVAFTRKPHPLG